MVKSYMNIHIKEETMKKVMSIIILCVVFSVIECRNTAVVEEPIIGVSALVTLTDDKGNLIDEHKFTDPEAQGFYGPVDMGPDIYSLRAGQTSSKNPLHLETFYFKTMQGCVKGPERYDLTESRCKGIFQYCEDLVSWEDPRCLDEQWSLISLEKGSYVEVKETSFTSEGRKDSGVFQFILFYPDGKIRKITGEYNALMKHSSIPQ